jgi:hypothetical protein
MHVQALQVSGQINNHPKCAASDVPQSIRQRCCLRQQLASHILHTAVANCTAHSAINTCFIMNKLKAPSAAAGCRAERESDLRATISCSNVMQWHTPRHTTPCSSQLCKPYQLMAAA